MGEAGRGAGSSGRPVVAAQVCIEQNRNSTTHQVPKHLQWCAVPWRREGNPGSGGEGRGWGWRAQEEEEDGHELPSATEVTTVLQLAPSYKTATDIVLEIE